jgi:hypothetical protein
MTGATIATAVAGGHRGLRYAPGMIDLDRVRHWTELLQGLPDGSLEQAAHALGLSGTLAARSARSAAVEPSPAGALELVLVRDEHGLTRVDLELAAGVSREQLDRALGPGVTGPQASPGAPWQRRHLRASPGRPHYCVVYAEFDGEEPSPDAVTALLTVMRERRE